MPLFMIISSVIVCFLILVVVSVLMPSVSSIKLFDGEYYDAVTYLIKVNTVYILRSEYILAISLPVVV